MDRVATTADSYRPGMLDVSVRPTTRQRLPRLLAGLALFGIGIALMVRADLGLSPWEVLHQGLAGRTPLTIGQVSIATSFVVLLLWVPLRERPGVGTMCNVVMIGLVVDATLAVLPPVEGLVLRWTLMLAGPVVIAIGSGLYIGVGLGPGPRDGLMTGLARRGWPVGVVRSGIEASVLVAGWLLGGTVGVGTVLFTVTIGPLVHRLLPRLALDDRYLRAGRRRPKSPAPVPEPA